MRFSLSSSALSSRLLSLSRVINNKNSLPILSCFLFQVKDNVLTITASDSENVMKTTIELTEHDGDGEFAVQSQTILDAVKELPEQPLTLNVNLDEHVIYLTYQNGSYHFPVQSAEEYPREQEMGENASKFALDAQVLSSAISRSLFAAAQDELRPVMNGIYFDLKPDCLSIVATDGHKLVRNRNFEVKSEAPASFILPSKPAALLKLMTGKAEGEAGVSFDSNNACFTIANATLTCRLIEGRYPNYNSVIPQDNPNKLTVDRKALIGALRRVLPFASESTQSVRLHIDGSKLIVSSEDVDFAKTAKEAVICEYEGRTMDIGFKCPSLIEILSNMDSDEVTIALADPSRAGVIEPSVQPDNAEVLMLIMPMLLND